MGVAKNNAGKTALSAALKMQRSDSGVHFWVAALGASRLRVERGWQTQIARNAAKRNEGCGCLPFTAGLARFFAVQCGFFAGWQV